MELKLSIATESEYREINDFYNLYNSPKRSFEAFLWEFKQCPPEESIYVIARAGEEVVGIQAIVPVFFEQGEGIMKTGKAEDTLVAPHYRGKGLFKELYLYAEEAVKQRGYSAVWAYTKAVKPYASIGFQVHHRHYQTLVVKDVFTAYSYLASKDPEASILKRLKILLLCTYASMARLRAFTQSKRALVRISARSGSKQIPPTDAFFQIREENYLHDRIARNPYYFEVRVVEVELGGSLQARFWMQYNQEGIAYLVHEEYDPECSDFLAVYKALVRHLPREVKLLRNWVYPWNPYFNQQKEAFAASGWVFLKMGIPIVFKPINGNTAELSDFLFTRLTTEGMS